ncbi:MAG: outer membrane protein assembly factor BamA, partial [Burkholderiales bacterium]|nr:outer membrane protein assembly factor BamA [Burkholderiales bacterium]
MNRNILLIFVLLFSGIIAFADNDDFIINNIRVNGLQRIEIGTIYSYLPVKVGDRIDADKLNQIITQLYKTGFFNDVRIEHQGNILIIDVQERPVITDLTVTGAKIFDHDALIKSLKENNLYEGKIFDQSLLDQAILALKAEYYNRGLYSVNISSTIVPLERNRVSININITEGDYAKIASILFVGNTKFSENTLRKQMFLSTGSLLSWWYKDNQYSSDKLAGDIEAVRAYYLNQGYINFKINSVQVQLTPNKKDVYITINLYEGSQYLVNLVKIDGQLKNVPKSEITPLILLKSGQIVNQELINQTIK